MLTRITIVILLVSAFASTVAAQYAVVGASPALTVGNPKAEHRIEAFYDLQCGSCVKFHENLKKVIARYPDKVFVVFRHFPLQMHDQAFMASSVVEAAKRQGKGIEMIDLLLSEQDKWSSNARPFQIILGYADRLGLDRNKFRTDVTSDDVIRSVVLDMNRGKRLEVSYTPSVFLNGHLLSFPDSLELEKFISKGN